MVADDHRSAGFEHLVRRLHILRARRGRVLHAPVNGNHQKVALEPRLLDGLQNPSLVHSRRSCRFTRIRKEVHVRLVVLIRISAAVKPARHAQPAHFDAVGLDHDRLPTQILAVARSGKEHSLLAQMLARFGKAGPALIHHVVVGE